MTFRLKAPEAKDVQVRCEGVRNSKGVIGYLVFDSSRGSAFMSGGVGGSDSSIGAPPEVRVKDLEQWDGTNWMDLGDLREPGITFNRSGF